VTTGEPELNQEQGPAAAPEPDLSQPELPKPDLPKPELPKPDSAVKRVREWFWRGAALRETQQSFPEPSARAFALAQRARSSADLALNSADLARSAEGTRSALTPSDPLETLAEASTCELYRESVYWALCSLSARSDDGAGTSYSDAIWDTLDEQLLLRAAKSEQRVPELRRSLRDGSFVYFAELPAAEQSALSQELAKLSSAMLEVLDRRTRAVQGVLLQRAARLGLLVLLVLLVGAGFIWERKTRELRNDLAQGKPWRASSKYQDLGCTSPEQECPNNPPVFFCTLEEKEPWIEFDLGSAKEISAVQVDNRADCCSERAVPLIVEVSENHKRWRTVGRRDTDFTTWRADFQPVKARWVRLKAQRVTFLHLQRVRILP